RQSREPFRYTCSIDPIKTLPDSPKVREVAWLKQDLAELLSQRVERIRFVDGPPGAGQPGGQREDSHIVIGGEYVVRARDDDGKQLLLEVMPSVAIGAQQARKLAYPVSFPPDPVSTPLKMHKSDDGKDTVELAYGQYKALLERVYSSVAT